jgi:hypothetical protein
MVGVGGMIFERNSLLHLKHLLKEPSSIRGHEYELLQKIHMRENLGFIVLVLFGIVVKKSNASFRFVWLILLFY